MLGTGLNTNPPGGLLYEQECPHTEQNKATPSKRGLAISSTGASQSALLSVPWLAGTAAEMLL